MKQERLTAQEYRKKHLDQVPAHNKFNVGAKPKRTWAGLFNGRFQTLLFHSTKEMNRFCELLVLLKSGEIRQLELQPKFDIEYGTLYYGDFLYFEISSNKWVCEDVKGFQTQIFKLKWKRVNALFSELEFRII